MLGMVLHIPQHWRTNLLAAPWQGVRLFRVSEAPAVTAQQLKLQRGRALIGYGANGREKKVEGEKER